MTHSSQELEDALYELALRNPLTQEAIEQVVANHPEHAEALRMHAPTLALEQLSQSLEAEEGTNDADIAPLVEKALQRFRKTRKAEQRFPASRRAI